MHTPPPLQKHTTNQTHAELTLTHTHIVSLATWLSPLHHFSSCFLFSPSSLQTFRVCESVSIVTVDINQPK